MISITEESLNWWCGTEFFTSEKIPPYKWHRGFYEKNTEYLEQYKTKINDSVKSILDEHVQYSKSCDNKTFPFVAQLEGSTLMLPMFKEIRELFLSNNNQNLLNSICSIKCTLNNDFFIECFDKNGQLVAQSIELKYDDKYKSCKLTENDGVWSWWCGGLAASGSEKVTINTSTTHSPDCVSTTILYIPKVEKRNSIVLHEKINDFVKLIEINNSKQDTDTKSNGSNVSKSSKSSESIGSNKSTVSSKNR